jgi:high-affinity iron transporter
MVGNTVRIWQVVGWLPIHNLGAGFPAWMGLWFGTFATWEGVLLPALAVGAVIGSYFLAEGQKTRSVQQKTVVQVN